MSQAEVYKVIKDNPRVTTREIREMTGLTMRIISKAIERMMNKDVMADVPTQLELNNLFIRFPSLKKAGKSSYAVNRIRVYEVIS